MNIKVEDLMIDSVISTHQHQTVGHVKDIMKRNKVHSLPIINSENELEGIVTNKDFTDAISNDTQVGHIMTKKVYTIPKYSSIHIAARIMHNHRIHHLIVTHDKKVVGILSSFDLLALIEKHRFVLKNGSSEQKKKKKNF